MAVDRGRSGPLETDKDEVVPPDALDRSHLATGPWFASRASVAVVTWNAADHVARALAALPPDMELIVVDNASTDATVDIVQSVAPHAVILRNSANVGFAAAVNQAVRAARPGEYLLLLNPDATVDARSIGELVARCDAEPDVAVASAVVVDARGRPERTAGGSEPTLLGVACHELGLSSLAGRRALYRSGSLTETQDRDWVAGTCMLMRRRALEEVGGFDEAYFLYAEDIDWCRRAREAGWRVTVVHGAVATHDGSRSVGQAGPWIDAHRLGSLDRYFAQRHRWASLVVFRVVRSLGAAGRAVVFGLTSRGRPQRAALARRRWRDARLALRPPRPS